MNLDFKGRVAIVTGAGGGLGGGGQVAVKDQIGDFFVGRMLGEVFDGIAAVGEAGFDGADGASGARPEAWRQWFDAQGLDIPQAMAGPRYELFSMQVAAALHGLGVSLMPTLLISEELKHGELVIACPRPLTGLRSYYLIEPQHTPSRDLLTHFKAWLIMQSKI